MKKAKARKVPTPKAPAPRKWVSGKAWYAKFAGGDPARMAAFKAATSVRTARAESVMLSKFVPEQSERKEVAAVLRAKYPAVKVQVAGRDYKLTRAL